MSTILKLATLLASAGNYENGGRTSNEDILKKVNKNKPKKPMPKGLKEFEIDGHKIYAINKKNAIRKANKKGIL